MSRIRQFTAPWLARLQQRLPERRAGLVPAEAFFCREVELPAGLAADEKTALVELFLESKAPFPLEQLHWGYVSDPAAPRALAYATTKGRLRQLGFDAPESFVHLFPSFLSRFGDTFAVPTIRFIAYGQTLSAVFHAAGHPVPQKIHSAALQQHCRDDDAWLAARDQLLQSLPHAGFVAEPGLWLCLQVSVDQQDHVSFLHHRIGAPTAVPESYQLALDNDSLWAADLRDPSFAQRERANRKRSRAIWQSLRLSAAVALFLLIWQLFTFGLNGFNLFQEQRMADLSSKALRVENKFTLANRLTESTEQDIQPFGLLESINPLRPDSVYFNRVRARAYNRLEIEGDSEQGVTPVNSFADALERLPFVGSVENNVQTRNNQTSFRFVIEFSSPPPATERPLQLPPAEPQTVAQTTEEAG